MHAWMDDQCLAASNIICEILCMHAHAWLILFLQDPRINLAIIPCTLQDNDMHGCTLQDDETYLARKKLARLNHGPFLQLAR